MNIRGNKFIHAGAPAAACLSLMGFAAHQIDPLAPVTVERSYESADLGRIDLMGACTIGQDTVSCWDPEGKLDADLSEKVKAYYIVQSSTEIRMKFGRKNRMIAFREPSRNYGGDVTISSVKGEGNQNMNSAGQLPNYGANREPVLTWYEIDTDPSQTQTSVGFDISVRMGSGLLPVKEGAEISVGPLKVKVTGIKRGPDRKQNWGANPNVSQKTWTITVTVTGSVAGKIPNMYLYGVDDHGMQVSRVDAGGAPIHPKVSGTNMYQPISGGFDAQVYSLSGAGTATQEYSSTINPSKLSGLNISASGSRIVTFKNILLDPK